MHPNSYITELLAKTWIEERQREAEAQRVARLAVQKRETDGGGPITAHSTAWLRQLAALIGARA